MGHLRSGRRCDCEHYSLHFDRHDADEQHSVSFGGRDQNQSGSGDVGSGPRDLDEMGLDAFRSFVFPLVGAMLGFSGLMDELTA